MLIIEYAVVIKLKFFQDSEIVGRFLGCLSCQDHHLLCDISDVRSQSNLR